MELRKLRKRPSINLIKMKNTKLSSSPSLFKNFESLNDDNLVKFIDVVDIVEQQPIDQQVQHEQKIICNCNATMQQYTQKVSVKQPEADISSICGSKSSDSGYYSDLNFKLNDSLSSCSSSIVTNHHHHHHHHHALPKHNYFTRYNAATGCKLNCSSTCTCDLDLNQIEND